MKYITQFNSSIATGWSRARGGNASATFVFMQNKRLKRATCLAQLDWHRIVDNAQPIANTSYPLLPPSRTVSAGFAASHGTRICCRCCCYCWAIRCAGLVLNEAFEWALRKFCPSISQCSASHRIASHAIRMHFVSSWCNFGFWLTSAIVLGLSSIRSSILFLLQRKQDSQFQS